MKILKIATLSAALILTTGVARGTHMWEDPNAWWSGHFGYDVSGPRYTPQEFSLDLFGSYQAVEDGFGDLFETNIRHGVWGGGVGLNYFITRNIGISVDSNIPDNRGNFVDHVSGSLLARFPIGPSGWAPYLFGGGGRGTDPEWEWLVHAGVGFEYRWNPATGIFIDGRYVWADKTFDRLLLRAGLRVVF
jgi:hypothetical protein